VIVDLALNTTKISAGRDSLPSIENATGSSLADTLIGDTEPNVLRGGGGKDKLVGGGGKDSLLQ
jgi:Ca2+-binding RTX toxin-like protein